MFVPGLLEKLAPLLKAPRGYVVLTSARHMPKTTLPNAICYEELIAGRPTDYPWPDLDENDASALLHPARPVIRKGVL
jgi:fatty-acyl-CoA synthase